MREEIIKMAREAKLGFLLQDNWAYHERVERFFHMAQAVEREACAKVAESFDPHMRWSNYGLVIANRIRARGQA